MHSTLKLAWYQTITAFYINHQNEHLLGKLLPGKGKDVDGTRWPDVKQSQGQFTSFNVWKSLIANRYKNANKIQK